MKRLGIVGWRGMVGSVLMQRMTEEKDFDFFQTYFFSTSQAGQAAPQVSNLGNLNLLDAYSLEKLKEMDIILTCQGSDYTVKVHQDLRDSGWSGYWVDAASKLRMSEESCIILDPVNLNLIKTSLEKGVKDFIGGNCTVSLMLMGLGGLFREGLVEWATSMTYQAASGAGAKNMLELIKQMRGATGSLNLDANILELESQITQYINSNDCPKDNFGVPLAASLIPWIDVKMESGQSKEEWKAQVEANKILGSKSVIPIDGTCVRVSSFRSHAQALTVKLNKNISVSEIENIIQSSNDWVRVIPNDKEWTIKDLTPAKISGTMDIPVGRIRKMTLGDEFLNVFTCGDQLLWGAAEPLRRFIRLL